MNFLSKFFIKLLNFLLLLTILSCSQKPAKIVNRNKVLYDKQNQFNHNKYQASENKKNRLVASQKNLNQDNKISQANSINKDTTSQKKEIDQEIKTSKTQDQLKPNSYKNSTNSAKNSNIPNEQYHLVKKGETLFSIAKLYQLKVEDLAKQNQIAKPYNLKLNQKIQISSTQITSSTIETQQTKAINSKNSITKEILKEDNKDLTNNQNQQILTKNNSNIAEQTINNNNSQVSTTSQQNTVIDSDQENSIVNKKNKFLWPVRGQVVSKFGPKKGGLYNDGINIKAKEGLTVGASEDGIVAYAGSELKGYGNLVIIKHANSWITAYAHLKEFSVAKGQKVLKAQKIGSVGNSGHVSFPQLYFGLRKGRNAVNPQEYLQKIN
jgi:murein DD-endopeptidase MepM/ murein hydrolase activator NlpD